MSTWEREEFDADLREAKAVLPAIIAKVERLELDAEKATPSEILAAIELLECRYHRDGVDPDTAKLLDAEWIEDLADISRARLKAVCKAWRMSDNAFAPRSAGQLLAKAKCPVSGPLWYSRRAVKAIQTALEAS